MLQHMIDQLAEYKSRESYTSLPQAAVLIPLTNDDIPDVILTRRSMNLSVHKGEVAFPGGKQDQTDSTLEVTALREAYEEINLPVNDVHIIGRTGTVISKFGIEVTPYVGIIPSDAILKPNAGELESIFRVPFSFFSHQSHLKFCSWNYQQKQYKAPIYQYEQYTIWGLTAMIVAELLQVTCNQTHSP